MKISIDEWDKLHKILAKATLINQRAKLFWISETNYWVILYKKLLSNKE